MLRAAIADIPEFSVLDLEVKREGPSYTVDTLETLHDQYPDHDFYLMMGEDALTNFFKWHKSEDIVSLAHLLVGRRTTQSNPEILGNADIQEALRDGLTETRLLDISSTEIRDRLKKRLYCGHLVPARVLEYIFQNKLYL